MDASARGVASGPRTSVNAPRWTEFPLISCLALGWLFWLFAWVPLATFPYQIDYGEGLMMEGAMCIRQGRALYPAVNGFSGVIHVYGPLAYAAAAATLPADGVSFTVGRFLMLLCTVAISAMIAVMLWRRTHSMRLGVAFGLLLPLVPAFRFWSYLLRADLIGIAISIAGLMLYATKPKYAHWTIPFFVTALFCKYSLLAAPFAVFLHMIAKRRAVDAVRFAVILGLSCESLFLLLQRKTAGAFAFHMFSTHPDGYSLTQFFHLAALAWLGAPVVTGLAGYYIVSRLGSGEADLASLYFVSASINSLTAGKPGAATNHFLEWMIAACMCAGLGYAALRSRYPRRMVQISLILGFSVLLAVVMQNRPASQPFSELSECAGAYQYVAQSRSSRVLSQSLGPLLLTGKPVLLTDPFVYGQLVEHGRWSDSALVQQVKEQYFGLIIVNVDPEHLQTGEFSIWPKSLLDALGHNYHAAKHFNCRDSSQMLEPKP